MKPCERNSRRDAPPPGATASSPHLESHDLFQSHPVGIRVKATATDDRLV